MVDFSAFTKRTPTGRIRLKYVRCLFRSSVEVQVEEKFEAFHGLHPAQKDDNVPDRFVWTVYSGSRLAALDMQRYTLLVED